MRIKEVNIQRYGPLPKFFVNFDEGVQVIYGLNESGKTLLIDAIMKMLIGGKKFHSSLGRVERTPEGYITIDQDGKEIQLDDDVTLTTLMNISPEELRNVFVIRDADLHIADEDKFYERVQDKIVGLRSSDIRRIITALKGRGRLAPKKGLSDDKKYGKAKSTLKEAKSLRKEIIEYLEESKTQNIEGLELEILRARSEHETLKKQIQIVEKAQQRQEYERIKADFDNIKSLSSERDSTPQESLNQLQEKIKAYEQYEGQQDSAIRKQTYYRNISIWSLILSATTFFGAFLLAMPVLSILIPTVIFLVSVYSIYQWRKFDGYLSDFEEQEHEIHRLSQNIDITTEIMSEIKAKMNESISRFEEIQVLIHEKSGVVKNFFSIKTDSTSELIDAAKQRLTKMEEDIDFTDSPDYSESDLKNAREGMQEAETLIKKITKRLDGHAKSLDEFSKRINDLNYATFMPNELDITVDNLDSLNQLLTPLEELMTQIELDAETATKAISFFEELESEEEAKIEELFSKESPASEIYSEITSHRYNNVRYDTSKKKVLVERENGDTFLVKKLSQGARDQLYLAIRVALGQKILEGSTGFFIMDDALLAADENRLRIQTELIRQLSEKGWQIIYFTMKREALDAISGITENKPMMLAQLP